MKNSFKYCCKVGKTTIYSNSSFELFVATIVALIKGGIEWVKRFKR